jgi:hypothetical protein
MPGSHPAGSVAYALQDLTGFPVERISLREALVKVTVDDGSMWEKIKAWTEMG